MSFALDIQKFAKHCTDNADTLVRKTVQDVTGSIDEISPVGDATGWEHPEKKPPGYVGGHFRSNWQLGIDALPTGEIPGHDYEGRLEQEQAKIPKNAAAHVYYYANNVPYAQALEDGHSKNQAPHGMVSITAVKFQGFVAKNARELK